MDHDDRHTGALPPPDMTWQIGKTAATVRFVNEASAYLETCSDDDERACLEDAVSRLKHGHWTLTVHMSVQEYLADR